MTRAWRRNLTLKGMSMVMALLLWFFVAFRVETIQRTEEVPIEFRNLPKNNLYTDEPRPSKTRVTLIGSERDFKNFDPKNLMISIDLQSYQESGVFEISLKEKNVHLLNLPSGIQVQQFETPAVKLVISTKQEHKLELPIIPVLEGTLPAKGFYVDKENVKVVPDKVMLMGAQTSASHCPRRSRPYRCRSARCRSLFPSPSTTFRSS